MNKELAQATMVLMNRVTIQGNEVNTWLQIVNSLNEIINENKS
jgi:hypothetical protein